MQNIIETMLDWHTLNAHKLLRKDIRVTCCKVTTSEKIHVIVFFNHLFGILFVIVIVVFLLILQNVSHK